jgi:hypothetical protein
MDREIMSAVPPGRNLAFRHGSPSMMPQESDDARTRLLRDVLARLQDEAADVFVSSGETVARFLRERRDEAERKGPARAISP